MALLVNVHSSPAIIADLIHKQTEDNYDYIHPRRDVNVSVQRSLSQRLTRYQINLLSGLPHRSQPYRSTIIISVICDVFFLGPFPFVTRHKELFPTYITTGDVIQEVPRAMVALVSTAVCFSVTIVDLLADQCWTSFMQLSRSGPAANINTRTFQQIQIWMPTGDISTLLTRSRPRTKEPITG